MEFLLGSLFDLGDNPTLDTAALQYFLDSLRDLGFLAIARPGRRELQT
jgi:hypothetical protein